MRQRGRYASGLPDVTEYQKPVVKLDSYTATDILSQYMDEVVMDYDVSRRTARSLVLNALARNTVAEEVHKTIGYMMTGGV